MSNSEQFKKDKKSSINKIKADLDRSFDELKSVISAVEVSSDNLDSAQTLKNFMKENKHEDAGLKLGQSPNTLRTRMKSKADWRVAHTGGKLRCILID